MSREIGRSNQRDVLDLESGLEALRQSPEFRGPVEPVDDHGHGNDHFALVYEDREEQFAAAVPFVRRGLERGERCLYIADDNSREEVRSAMRDAGIDVDAALESGTLTVTTAGEIYLKNGTFDLEESLATLETYAAEATADFEGFRIVSEETWLLESDSSIEDFMRLESRVNDLFRGESCLALCQYDRERFPATVVREVIETHPYLICDDTVSQNFYYTPPEDFFGPEDPDQGVDRMLGTLRERTEAKSELRAHKEYLRELHETTANSELSFEESVEELIELGCERFDLRGGALAHLPEWEGDFRAEVTVGSEMPDAPSVLPVQPGNSCFCRQAIRREVPTAVPDVVDRGWDDDVYREMGLQTYFGIRVTAGSDPYGTLWFYDTSPRDEPFTEDERTFLEMMGRWVSSELERTERNRAQRELYDITADSDLSFDEKVEQLLDLGRDRFGLDQGFFLENKGDRFRVRKTRGTDLEEGIATLCANPDQYCKRTVSLDVPLGVEDAEAAGWDDDPLYEEYDLGCYLGTRVTDDTGVFGSLCFADGSSRDIEFTDAEYTFLDLMGQWLSYELDRENRERYLREQNEITADADRSFEGKLQALFELGCERFDLELGAMAKVDPEADSFELEYVSDDHEHFEPGARLPLSETYCTAATETGGAASVTDPREDEYDDIIVNREFGLKAYLGTYVEVDGGPNRTFFFVTSEPRDEGFSEAQRTFHHLMGEWVRKELNRRQRERELERTERQFEATFNNPVSFVGLLDPDGTVRRINENALEFADVDESAVRGEKFWETPWFAHSEAVREELRAGVSRAADGEYVRDEIPHRSPDGDTVIMDSMLEPVQDEDGEVVAIVPSGHDVTDRKHHESQLEERNERLESFASMLAHELRNPVTIGQIYGQQLSAEADSESVDYVVEAFDRIEDMIDVMLVLTRGREAVGERTSVALADAAREAWGEVDAADASLEVATGRAIRVDETYIRHLFKNLLENAVEHGSTSDRPATDDAVERGGDDVTITVGELPTGFYVADDGAGIPEAERDLVFEAGYTTAADTGGTGLGLAFVKKLAEVYEWECSVTESESGGARFEFRNVDGASASA